MSIRLSFSDYFVEKTWCYIATFSRFPTRCNRSLREVFSKRAVRVSVGSTNPVKVRAARAAFRSNFPNAQVAAVKVNSGVGSQPYDHEIARGALVRAGQARRMLGADFGVGIEGGIMMLGGIGFLCGCCAIVSQSGECHLGYGPMLELPKGVLEIASRRNELGDVIDELTGRKNVKQSEGAIGVYTGGRITRERALELAVLFALSPFVNKTWQSSNL